MNDRKPKTLQVNKLLKMNEKWNLTQSESSHFNRSIYIKIMDFAFSISWKYVKEKSITEWINE